MADASPRFRRDLSATAVTVEGLACVDVTDTRNGASFRFYDFEYELALQLDGRPLDAIIGWGAATYGLELTPAVIDEFAGRLAELGFLAGVVAVESGAIQVVDGDVSDDSQPVSQVVSRAMRGASQVGSLPVAAAAPPSPSPSPTLGLDEEWTFESGPSGSGPPPGGFAPSRPVASPSAPPAPGWPFEPDARANQGRTTVREMTAEPAGTDTIMGFEGRKTSMGRAVVVGDGDEPEKVNAETMMGFAAVSDADIEAAGGIRPPARPGSTSSRGAVERRQPPPPESVQMAPFQQPQDDLPQWRIPPEGTRARPERVPNVNKGRWLTVVMWVVILVAAAAGVGYYLWTRQQAGLESRRVQTISPRPAAVYRWFDTRGTVVVGETRGLSFSSAGAVAEILRPGVRFAAGEIIAKLKGAAALEAEVNHSRSRLGFYQQMRDSMKTAGNQAQLQKEEAKVAEKTALLAEAVANLDRLVIRAAEPGEVVEVAVKPGMPVAANALALRVKSGALMGEFPLGARDAETAGHLGFCRVEVIGQAPTASNAPPPRHGAGASAADSGSDGAPGATRFADCKLGPTVAPGEKLEVEMPAGGGLAVGQPLRLARIRYDGVFPVPRTAIVRAGDTDRIYVAGPGGIAEPRAVTLADADAYEALVSQGIDVGDRVIVNPPPDLNDGEPIKIEK